jgi:hypothetical protein
MDTTLHGEHRCFVRGMTLEHGGIVPCDGDTNLVALLDQDGCCVEL